MGRVTVASTKLEGRMVQKLVFWENRLWKNLGIPKGYSVIQESPSPVLQASNNFQDKSLPRRPPVLPIHWMIPVCLYGNDRIVVIGDPRVRISRKKRHSIPLIHSSKQKSMKQEPVRVRERLVSWRSARWSNKSTQQEWIEQKKSNNGERTCATIAASANSLDFP